MKRLLGLIGLVYLSVLAAVFYFNISAVIVVISVSVIITAVIIRLVKRDFEFFTNCVVLSLAAICAVLSLFLYQNIVYNPVIDKYSDKEIKISGYIADEPQLSGKGVNYIIETYSVNGVNERLKILFRSYNDLHLDEFDKLSAGLTVTQTDFDRYKSEGIFLSVNSSDKFEIQPAGEKEVNLYSYAVGLRVWIKEQLSRFFKGNDYGVICAVMLGDKSALTDDLNDSFRNTGMSHLIVVSGLHLSILLSLFTLLFKKLKPRLWMLISASAFILVYSAITGFAPSVVRAGIMQFIILLGYYFSRQPDSINSLGLAALALTLGNPYAVGNIGLLMSFAATFGILIWATPLYNFLVKALRLNSFNKRAFELKIAKKRSPRFLAYYFANRIVNFVLQIISVSLTASLWIMPITVLAFGKISPLSAIISIFAEPLAAVLLFCSLLTVVFCFIPNPFNPFALAAALCGKLLIFVIKLFAGLPFASIKADKPYFYIWIAVTVLLAIGAYFMWRYRKKGARYPVPVILLSALTLLAGFSITRMFRDKSTYLTVNCDSAGMIAAVNNDSNVSVLCCGGTNKSYKMICESLLSETDTIDYLVVPRQTKYYSSLYERFTSEFDVQETLVYDNKGAAADADCVLCEPYTITKSNLLPGAVNSVYAYNNFSCQYLKTDGKSVLLLTTGTDISKIPVNMRAADIIVTASVPANCELLTCTDLYFTGSQKTFQKHLSDLEGVCDSLIRVNCETIKIKCNGE